MPVQAPRVCGHCGGAHASGARCAAVAARDKERKARFDRKRPNSSQRGYDRQWEAAAKAFLAEPGNQYCRCGALAVAVMHRISIRKRPELRMERSNWMPGCHRCNAIDAARERRNTKGPTS